MVCLFIGKKLTPEHLTALTDCCPTQALTVCGEVKSVEEIMTTVLAR
ncbi:putative pyruvate formate-lyase 3-activating enzyme [Escherichia coli]|nr:putative pyruvate formate-lyase 3-activating enzyme [Escherichia coli]